jgi:hypothetical protein
MNRESLETLRARHSRTVANCERSNCPAAVDQVCRAWGRTRRSDRMALSPSRFRTTLDFEQRSGRLLQDTQDRTAVDGQEDARGIHRERFDSLGNRYHGLWDSVGERRPPKGTVR